MDAHERHWNDAEQLFIMERWANADHLYGIAAECGLKRLMLTFGMTVNSKTGSPENLEDRVHANKIWARFESYRSGRAARADYILPTSNPFDNWDVADRYAHQSNFHQTRVQEHRAGAQAICNLIKKAQYEGTL